MNFKTTSLLNITESAVNKVKSLFINKKNSNFKLRVYITGGGCNGFKYCFILDDCVNECDFIIKKKGISLIVDSMSLQYLIGSYIDYKEELEGSRFIVINSNIKNTCGCGLSFNV